MILESRVFQGRIPMKKPRGFALILFCWAVFAAGILPATAGSASVSLPELDPQGVFCAYYSLSGEIPEDPDIEDLYWDQGRPTFSSFKPAEMFSLQSLRDARGELEDQIRGIGRDTVFRWEPEGVFVQNAGGGASFRFKSGPDALPQATELIRAEIPSSEWKRIEKALKDVSSSLNPRSDESRMTIMLRPVRAEKRLETRNIARHDVAIPVRCVVFRPVSIEAPDDAGNPRVHILQ